MIASDRCPGSHRPADEVRPVYIPPPVGAHWPRLGRHVQQGRCPACARWFVVFQNRTMRAHVDRRVRAPL